IYTGTTRVEGGTLEIDGSIGGSGEVVVNHSGVSGGMTDGRLLIDSAGARTLGNAGTGSGDLIVGDDNFGYLQHGADPGPTAATSTVGHDLIVGRSAGGDGLVDVNDGTTLNVTNQLRIGNGAGTGIVNVKAGSTLNVLGNTTIIDSPVPPDFGTLNIAGAFNENGDLIVGDNFTGVVNQTAGTASVNNDMNATGNLIMGRTSATSVGTYNLTDGTLWVHGDGTTAAGPAFGNSDIGAVGVGVVNQNGGTVLNDTHMTVGAGAAGSQYNLAAGTLNFRDRVASTQAVATDNAASTLTVASGGDFNFTGGTLMNVSTIDVTAAPAQSGAMYAGTFLQEGGDFVIGVDGGLDVNDANLTRALTQINGNFAQTGGSLTVDIFGDKVRGRSGEAGDNFFNLGDPLVYATDSDLLYVTGTAELDGSVDLTIASDLQLPPWGWYDVVFANGGITLGSGFSVNGGAGLYRILDTPNGQILQVAVPEPATLAVWSLLGLALAGFGWLKRRRAA
ncbi:MAG: PEP-CTERM sorting domain-containing protein, partial [Planctomycetales bacterium]|nr:PEP-CTERM sorting domain-containing protein [Planctomycetales bacterium]